MLRARRSPAGRPRRRPILLGFETMEPRQLLATFTVTSLDDAGPGTLREAIERANLAPDPDTITFAPGLTGTITLGDEGLPALRGELVLIGPGADVLTVAHDPGLPGTDRPGTLPIRIVTVAAGADVRLSGLTLSGGLGAIEADSNSLVGGGVFNAGSMTIADVVIAGNRLDFGGGGPPQDPRGGGILNTGSMTIERSVIRDNVGSRLSVLGRPIVEGAGGGIFNAGSMTIRDSVIAGNTSAAGGGISNQGTMSVERSSLVGNRAVGLSFSPGAAITNRGTLSLDNATLSGHAPPPGRFGVGQLNTVDNTGTLSVRSTTLSNVLPGIVSTGTLSLASSLIHQQGAMGASLWIEGGTMSSAGGNLVSDDPGVPLRPDDLVGVDPLLAPLADNGGPTPTHALLPGSPAIDAAGPAGGVATDQRGIPRPQGQAPDIGAFESRGFVQTIVSGGGQSTPVDLPLPAPLVVLVASPSGEPIAGGLVRFEAPRAGPSAAVAPEATIGPDGLASTTAVTNALPGAYDVIATSVGANPVRFTLTNRLGRLEVVEAVRLGFHARPTRIVLRFNQPLDPRQASRLENYRLFGPGPDRAPGIRPDRPLRLRAARFDAASNTVTLEPAGLLRLLGRRRYRVDVADAVRPGGGPGFGARAIVGPEDFVPPPELSRVLRQVRRPQRHRDGTGRLR